MVSVPHAGTNLPPDIASRLTDTGRALVDTDWHVDRLWDFARALGATVLVAAYARTVVDLNRSPAGDALYPGQAETTICPTESFDGEPLYAGRPPDAAEIAGRVVQYWQPYHNVLRQQLDRVRALHGAVHLLDAHSIRAVIPRLFAGRLPDLNYGTNSGASADPGLVARAMAATAPAGFSQVLDGRFRGGHITRAFGDPARGVHAIQLEISQDTYLGEASPETFHDQPATRLIGALQLLARKLMRV